jgi:3-isopropylmalate/(R)-2-methylmalate dehydratase small subunit
MAIEAIHEVRGTGLPLRGDNIDTDRIIPARFLKAITFEGLEAHLFEDDRRASPDHPAADPRFAGASILIVQANFGCGSSREHAPQAIRRRGIRAVVGESFSEIFFGNSVALGMPCVAAARADIDALQALVESRPELELAVDLDRMDVTGGGRRVTIALPPAARESFLSGTWDATALLLDDDAAAERVAARLPYLSGW